DPLVKPADQKSLNPYAYAGHNPISYSDSSGLMPRPHGQDPDGDYNRKNTNPYPKAPFSGTPRGFKHGSVFGGGTSLYYNDAGPVVINGYLIPGADPRDSDIEAITSWADKFRKQKFANLDTLTYAETLFTLIYACSLGEPGAQCTADLNDSITTE